jgi:hypothetical protein
MEDGLSLPTLVSNHGCNTISIGKRHKFTLCISLIYFNLIACLLRLVYMVLMGTGVLSPGVKARPGRDADHSPPSSAEVENE